MATSKRLARSKAVRRAPRKAKETVKRLVDKLYSRDQKAWFASLPEGVTFEEKRYAGFRAWHDGYLAGRASVTSTPSTKVTE